MHEDLKKVLRWLASLGEEMNTQEHDCQASPRFLGSR